MVSPILLRAHKTFLLKPNLQGKDLPRLLRPILVVYYDQARSSIKTDTNRQRSPPQYSIAPQKLTGAKITGQHYKKAKMTDKRKMT